MRAARLLRDKWRVINTAMPEQMERRVRSDIHSAVRRGRSPSTGYNRANCTTIASARRKLSDSITRCFTVEIGNLIGVRNFVRQAAE